MVRVADTASTTPKPRSSTTERSGSDSGDIAYYWEPQCRDIARGCPVHAEALGPDYAVAVERANLLNKHLDAWRSGLGGAKIDLAQRGYGTVAWLFDLYLKSPAFEKRVSERSRYEYRRALVRVEDTPTTTDRLGRQSSCCLNHPGCGGQDLRQAPAGAPRHPSSAGEPVYRYRAPRVGRCAPAPSVGGARGEPLAWRICGIQRSARSRRLPVPKPLPWPPHSRRSASRTSAPQRLICFEWLQRPRDRARWQDHVGRLPPRGPTYLRSRVAP